MVEQMRKMSIPIYIAAFVISVLIFAVGVYVGNTMDTVVKDSISSGLERAYATAQSSELLILLEDSPAFCPVYVEEAARMDKETRELGTKIAYAEDVRGISYPELKKQYFMLEAQAYLISKKVKEQCSDGPNLVLYFYSNEDCSSCAEQGHVLDAVRSSRNDTKVYSFDGDLGSSIVAALKNQYGVAAYPSIVVNGQVYNRFVNAEELAGILG